VRPSCQLNYEANWISENHWELTIGQFVDGSLAQLVGELHRYFTNIQPRSWARIPFHLTGLKNGWLVKRYYVKSVTELLLSMRVSFSPLKNSIWQTGCSCFSTGTAIFICHCQQTIEVTLDSFLIGNAVWIDQWLQWLSKKPFGRRTLEKLNILAVHTILDQTASSDCVKDWSCCLMNILSSVDIFFVDKACREGEMISWLQVSNFLIYYFITDHRETYWMHSMVVLWPFADHVFAHFSIRVWWGGVLLFYRLTSALTAARECYLMFK